MQIDQESLYDLSIFSREDGSDIFDKINFSLTSRGGEQLKANLQKQQSSKESILEIQASLQSIEAVSEHWPTSITNGTIMVLEKFLQATLDPIPARINTVNAYAYTLLHAPDFSLIKYSVPHFLNFLHGLRKICSLLDAGKQPRILQKVLQEINELIEKRPLSDLSSLDRGAKLTSKEYLEAARCFRYDGKGKLEELLLHFGILDAWYGMAMAARNLNLTYPEFSEGDELHLKADGLWHLLLKKPVTYDIELGGGKNMLFLTGANMAGKSTFIRAIGAAVHLAHAGMAVPATRMQLNYFDGLISNIQIKDDISKGESYFFNEVMRIRDTVIKISDRKKWLVLIDELFKGTNIEDAMKCSQTVIEGMLRSKNSIFIVSTHLYELGQALGQHSNIDFRYFETSVDEKEFSFSYRLLKGVSSDRLGYLILTREGLLKLLQDLG
jgi:DNA mismatch repair ATPase MutS